MEIVLENTAGYINKYNKSLKNNLTGDIFSPVEKFKVRRVEDITNLLITDKFYAFYDQDRRYVEVYDINFNLVYSRKPKCAVVQLRYNSKYIYINCVAEHILIDTETLLLRVIIDDPVYERQHEAENLFSGTDFKSNNMGLKSNYTVAPRIYVDGVLYINLSDQEILCPSTKQWHPIMSTRTGPPVGNHDYSIIKHGDGFTRCVHDGYTLSGNKEIYPNEFTLKSLTEDPIFNF